MRTTLSVLAVLAVLAAALFAPQLAAAAGTIPFADCGQTDGFQCARFDVPLDWASPTADRQVPLYVERRAAPTQPAKTALIALAGGPGQSATPFAESFLQLLGPLLGTRDLIVYDQRGTGRSGFLECPQAEQSASSTNDFVSKCASELGAARGDYSTRDTVDDIEAIRQALGVDKVSIFGVSYGTYVAQLYARRYPSHTESLILDSSVPPTGVDPFDRTSYRAVKAELVRLCAGGRCRGITKSALADATTLAARAQDRGGIPVTLVDPATAVPVTLRLGDAALFNLFQEGLPFDEVSRARLPAALVSALHGDSAPLGQVFSSLIGPAAESDPTSMSDALNLATFCSDTTLPWATSDSISARQAKSTAALDALPKDAFLPFPRASLLDSGAFNECVAWPVADPVTVPGATPDVPVLIFSGRDDTLTPYEDAVTVAKEFAHATIVRVPDTGHSVLTTSPGEAALCVQAALQRFAAGAAVADCPDAPDAIPPTRVDPTNLDRLGPTGASGRVGRTVTAALATLDDSLLTLFSRGTLTGLRGGRMLGTTSDFTLARVVYVPGISVSGTVDWESGIATLHVTGAGAHGTLQVVRGVGVTGRMAGKAVHAGPLAARMGASLGAVRGGRTAAFAPLVQARLDLLR